MESPATTTASTPATTTGTAAQVPSGGWSRTDRAVQQATVDRALAAKTVDRLLTDTGFLVHAHPDVVRPLLDRARSETALRASRIYRAALHDHPHPHPALRAWLLDVHAQRLGSAHLTYSTAPGTTNPTDRPAWQTGWSCDALVYHRCLWTLTGHTDRVLSVATSVVDDRPVAVTGSAGRTARIWDLRTGHQIGPPLTGTPVLCRPWPPP